MTSTSEPIILSIETATTNCSVAISRSATLLNLKSSNDHGYTHAEQLHVFIKEVLDGCDLEMDDLSAIAVGKGPGSYTGLRIGMSSAKGLAYALNIPLIGIPTLEILARGVLTDGLICSVIDARRMEVYTAIYDHNYNEKSSAEAKMITEDFYDNYIKEASEFVIVGTGSDKCTEVVKGDNLRFEHKAPSAKDMVAVAYEKFQQKNFEDVAYTEPFYLKKFEV